MHLTCAEKDLNIIQSCLNEDLLNISKWLIANKLTFNMTKTEFMLIGLRQNLNAVTASPVLSINGTSVKQVPMSKSLGVLIDANLTWGSHIEKLAKKIASCIAAIKRVRQFVASCLQCLDSAAFRLLQCCLGKLWHKTSRQTSKTPKSCSANSNFLKLWRRGIAAFPKFKLE